MIRVAHGPSVLSAHDSRKVW